MRGLCMLLARNLTMTYGCYVCVSFRPPPPPHAAPGVAWQARLNPDHKFGLITLRVRALYAVG